MNTVKPGVFQFKQDLVPVTPLNSTANSSPLIFTKYMNFSSFSFKLYWFLSQPLSYHKHSCEKRSNTQWCKDSQTGTQDTVSFLCSVTLSLHWKCSHCEQNIWQYTRCPFYCVLEHGSRITQEVCIHREFRALRHSSTKSGKLNCGAKINCKSCRLPMWQSSCDSCQHTVLCSCLQHLTNVALLPDSPNQHINTVYIIVLADSSLLQ